MINMKTLFRGVAAAGAAALGAAALVMAPSGADDDAKRWFAEVDANGDQRLDFEEYFSAHYYGVTPSNWRAAWCEAPESERETVSAAVRLCAIGDDAAFKAAFEEEVRAESHELFDGVDADGDGLLTFSEAIGESG